MSNTRKLRRPRRLAAYVPVRVVGGGKVPYRVRGLSRGKSAPCDGQMALDFGSDDPGALIDPPRLTTPTGRTAS